MPKIFHPVPDDADDIERASETLAMNDPNGRLHRGTKHINPHIETTKRSAVMAVKLGQSRLVGSLKESERR